MRVHCMHHVHEVDMGCGQRTECMQLPHMAWSRSLILIAALTVFSRQLGALKISRQACEVGMDDYLFGGAGIKHRTRTGDGPADWRCQMDHVNMACTLRVVCTEKGAELVGRRYTRDGRC